MPTSLPVKILIGLMALGALLGIVACGPSGQPDGSASLANPGTQPTGGISETRPPAPSPSASSSTSPVVNVSRQATAPQAGPDTKYLFLEVGSPEDDTVVDAPDLTVSGRTILKAVVSVNGDVVPVGADGTFSLVIQLDEGPNVVEVVASDLLGNEQSIVRSAIYEP